MSDLELLAMPRGSVNIMCCCLLGCCLPTRVLVSSETCAIAELVGQLRCTGFVRMRALINLDYALRSLYLSGVIFAIANSGGDPYPVLIKKLARSFR